MSNGMTIVKGITVKDRPLAPASDLLCSKLGGGVGQQIQANATSIDAPVSVNDTATEVVG